MNHLPQIANLFIKLLLPAVLVIITAGLLSRCASPRMDKEAGDFEQADRILTDMETWVREFEWDIGSGSGAGQDHLEMDTPLNTNYTKGVGFTPGQGFDPAPEESFDITDATQLRFPNARTDIVTFDRSAPQLNQAAQAAVQALGDDTVLRFVSPADNLLENLEVGVPKLQFITNQHFHYEGHDLLATWVLPPKWNPEKSYVPFLFLPGMLHTNNSKMFGQPGLPFLRTYFSALAHSDSDQIIMIHLNLGGRTSSGVYPDFEQVVDQALRWGAANLGLNLEALLTNGASRGGYTSMVLGGRLSAFAGYRVRGIFASVFGVVEAEYFVSPELVPSDIEEKMELGSSEYLRRLVGLTDREAVKMLGPLGAANTLGQAAETKGQTYVYLAYGTADPTMLPSSGLRLYDKLKDKKQVVVRADFYLGAGHEAGDERRNQMAATLAAALADDQPVDWESGLNYVEGDSYLHNPEQIPTHLRLPARTVARDQPGGPDHQTHIDLTGPANAAYRILIKDQAGTVVDQIEGRLPARRYVTPQITVPETPGPYTFELWLNDQRIGSETIPVDPVFPEEFESAIWRPDRMPVIYATVEPRRNIYLPSIIKLSCVVPCPPFR